MSRPFYHWQAKTLILNCHIQSSARNNKIEHCVEGKDGERVKIRINAHAIGGKANLQLIRFLAQQFGVSKSAVVISRGETSKFKTFTINNPAIFPDSLAITRP